MDFLKRNSGKIALLAIVAFFTLPFIYGNEEEEDFSPFAVKSGMSYQANPISKLANKIASFYGFSKPVSQMMASSGSVDSIKDKVSFNKEHSFNRGGSANSQNDTLVASSRNFKNFDTNSSNSNFSNTRNNNSKNNFAHNSYNNNDPIKGYVTINGQNYPVIEDALGNKYVVTPRGHIPYKDVMRRTISDKEFMAAKKRLAGASDMEVLAALQQEKTRQASASRQRYQANATSYKNGTATNMGGTNYARVSTEDTGFDEDVLNEAYADLKNINLKNGRDALAPSGSGTSRSSFSGGSARGNNSSDTQSTASTQNNALVSTGFSPGGLAQTLQEQVTARAPKAGRAQVRKGNKDESKEGKEESVSSTGKLKDSSRTGMREGQRVADMASPTTVVKVQKIKDENNVDTTEDFYKTSDDSENIFVAGNAWGEPKPIMIGDEEQKGVVVPIKYQKGQLSLTTELGKEVDNTIVTNMQLMNKSLEEIKDKIDALGGDVRIFIDNRNDKDDVSLFIMNDLIADKIREENIVVNVADIDDNTVTLIVPTFTPYSFDMSAKDFGGQVDKILQAGNEPA